MTEEALLRWVDAQIETDHQRPYLVPPEAALGAPNCDEWLLRQLQRIAAGDEPI